MINSINKISNIEVVGLGALNMDYLYRVERILEDGEQVERISRYRESELKWAGTFPGGSAANTIYGLAKLGVSTGFIGAVGDDAEGKILLQDFEKVGVDTGQIKVKPKAKTGSALCLSDKLNFRKISVSPATANSLLAMNDIHSDYLNRAEVLHISSFADDAQLEVLLELVDKVDSPVKISFSPGELYATKGLKFLTPILLRTYVLFINEKEIKQLTGEDIKTGAEACLKLGCHIVAVTLGKGASYKTVMATSYIRNAENEYVIEPSNKNIISALDTIGAGDAFATGFLYGLLNGKGIEECGRLGDIVAQFSLSKIGARPGLPTASELAQRYQELYPEIL
jgi:ribokinase